MPVNTQSQRVNYGWETPRDVRRCKSTSIVAAVDTHGLVEYKRQHPVQPFTL